MGIPILCHAVPPPLLNALPEQGFAAPAYHLLPETGAEPAAWHLALCGATMTLPQNLVDWRRHGLRAPVILLGQGQDNWEVTETLPLPLRLGALAARMRYYLALALEQPAMLVAWGEYNIDPARKTLCRGEAEQALTDKEAALLLLLAESGQAWGRDDLLREIWGYDSALDTHTLETHIYRLRRKLDVLGGGGDIVTTANGYQLSCG